MTQVAPRAALPIDERELSVGRRVQTFSELAGPIGPRPADDSTYEVEFRGLDLRDGRGRALRTLAVALFAFAFEAAVVLWVLQPTHIPPVAGVGFAHYANVFVVGSIMIMELLRLINVLFIALCSVVARDPVPVPAPPERKVAFLTTIVPSKEPIDVVRGTLQAALRIRYRGILDIWILDEGDDPAVKAMCRELGVNHFTRHGVARYNQRRGAFKAKTKHGNYNAWVAEYGKDYEIFLSVDPDHVPLPNYAERILGYFRDENVAFVSGPQCYANDETFVTRAAEAQQFLFHSLIQRAANRYNAAMLVGTNNAVRISSFVHAGGLSDSVTEDLATGLKFHARRNPATGKRWKSVYTPDVLAVGEGPSSWGDFFTQQMRWSRGTFEVLLTDYWRRLPHLRPGAALHYVLLSAFYPSMALGWFFGAANAVLFLTIGVQGIVVPVQLWFALYVDAAAIQLWLYLRNRRYNVSPYEAEGSSGLLGMLMSTVAAPIYASSMLASILRLPARFVVTPKGISSTADGVFTFRRHLQWGLLVVVAIVVAISLGHAQPAVLLWPGVMLIACAVPPVAWLVERVVGRDPGITAEPVADAGGNVGMTTESLERAALDTMIAAGSLPPRRSPVDDADPVPSVEPATTSRIATTGAPPSAPVGAVPSALPRFGSNSGNGSPNPRPATPPAPREHASGPVPGALPRGWVHRAEPLAPGSWADRPTAASGPPSPQRINSGPGRPDRASPRGHRPPNGQAPIRPEHPVTVVNGAEAGEIPPGTAPGPLPGGPRRPRGRHALDEPPTGTQAIPAGADTPQPARDGEQQDSTDVLRRVPHAPAMPTRLQVGNARSASQGPAGEGASDAGASDEGAADVHASTVAVRVVALAAVARPSRVDDGGPA